jgi:hypothetical protein
MNGGVKLDKDGFPSMIHHCFLLLMPLNGLLLSKNGVLDELIVPIMVTE